MDRAGLLKDLKKQVAALEDDLRERSETVEEFRTRLEAEYARARDGKRTAATYGAWRDERVTQAAAAWVLACVFVRFCEDNGLSEWPFLAGPGERLRDAEERHEAFFREKPHLNNRDWLVEAFQHLAGAKLAPEGGLRTIDPACGSGHFLLGIFRRLVEKWRAAEPGTDKWAIVRRALESVHGCDKNPFAVSIARFRLLVAAMRAAGAGNLY